VWVIYNYDEENVFVRHRFKQDVSFCIPKARTYLGLRNTLNRTSFDVSNVQDRILIEKFEEFEDFAAFCDLVGNNLSSNWKKWVLNRGVNLAVIETLHPEARNTYFFAYFSEPSRSFSSKFWNVKTKSIDEAKLMVLWFNSSLNFIQLLINRIPTGWFKIRGYVFEQLKAPSIERMSSSLREYAMSVFEKYKNEPFPAIWIQLARNVDKEKVQAQDWKLLKNTFENFEIEVGRGFEPRKDIDLLFLEILNSDLKNEPEFLSDLYLKLLKEICLIKKSAVEV
jgi:hypothetical protein